MPRKGCAPAAPRRPPLLRAARRRTPRRTLLMTARLTRQITVLKEGDVSGEDIDKNGYIDQHYYAIAEKSTLTTGAKLPVNEEKFKGCFGEEWSAVVAEGRAFNALEFKNKFDAFKEEGALDKAWDATNVDAKTRVKLGGGFYCGQIEVDGVKYCESGLGLGIGLWASTAARSS